MKHKISFLPYNIDVETDDGQTLIRTAMEAGIHINASCGGEGVCGKCRVIVEQGRVEQRISEKLSDEDRKKGYCLACLSSIKSDSTIRIPTESRIDTSLLNNGPKALNTARAMDFDINELRQKGLFIPPVEKIYIEMEPASPANNRPDVERIINYLRREHDEHRLGTDLNLIRKIPDTIRRGDFKITITIERPVRDDGKNHIINIEPSDTSQRNFAVAVDVGTTTVYGEIIDLNTGDVLAMHGEFNSQISYGEDVISRIIFAEKDNGLEILHGKIVGTINSIIKKIIKKAKVSKDEITSVTLAGNSTMTQLLLKINPRYIRRSPYVPASILYPPFPAYQIGLDLPDHSVALIYPGVSSYVGGDIVAGVMASGMYRKDELTLYMDIGTNAEIVIGNKDWLVCTSASAGPAFEGGGVKFGMRASRGAIEDFSIDPDTFEPMIITIGDTKARGICGSGLIALVAGLFQAGVIDSRGKFSRDLDTERIRQSEDIWEYVLVYKETAGIDRDITITEPDIDNLIRAKGAMYSAALTLLDEIGLKVSDIEKIILAGGFGSRVNIQSAMTIGLIMEIEPEKIIYLGNGSLLGCKMNALTNKLRQDVGNVVNMMTNFELSETPSYMNHYMSSLFLPHTDLHYFPIVRQRLKNMRKKEKKL